jgi:myosin heavy subunit
VEYSIISFREKNLDELSNLLMQVSTASKNPMVSYLFTGQTSDKKDKTLAKKIRTSMAELMKEL